VFRYVLVVEHNVRFPDLGDGNAYLLDSAESTRIPRQHDVVPLLSASTSATIMSNFVPSSIISYILQCIQL